MILGYPVPTTNPTDEGEKGRMTRTIDTPWYTKREAAAYLRITPDTLDRWITAGRVQLHKVEGLQSVRVHRDVLDALLVPVQAGAPEPEIAPA